MSPVSGSICNLPSPPQSLSLSFRHSSPMLRYCTLLRYCSYDVEIPDTQDQHFEVVLNMCPVKSPPLPHTQCLDTGSWCLNCIDTDRPEQHKVIFIR